MLKTLLWNHLPCNDEDAKALGAALNVHPAVARLLCMRGLGDPETARRFLHPSIDDLHDPYLLADRDNAVPELERAIAGRGRSACQADSHAAATTTHPPPPSPLDS